MPNLDENGNQIATPDLKSMGWGGWNTSNVFDNWDLNPLASTIGGGANGVRDTLSTERDAMLQPYMSQYRQKVGAGNSNDDDMGLWADTDFQKFVQTGQTDKGYKVDDNNNGPSTTQQWNASNAPQVEAPARDPRMDNFYNMLMGRATQTLNTDWKTDPNIRAQSDAYAAAQERARRNFVSDTAESAGPLANIQGEKRMAAEKAAQASAGWEGQLIGHEIDSRRGEISGALSGIGGLLSQDQQIGANASLANLDAKLKTMGFGLQDKSLNQGWQSTLLNQDMAQRQLGLNEWDRANYWDTVRSGLMGA